MQIRTGLTSSPGLTGNVNLADMYLSLLSSPPATAPTTALAACP